MLRACRTCPKIQSPHGVKPDIFLFQTSVDVYARVGLACYYIGDGWDVGVHGGQGCDGRGG